MNFLGRPFHYEDRLFPFYLFEYVHEVAALLDRCSAHRPLRVLEIGGNVGAWGRALMHAAPDAELYSFEPNHTPFALLERNRSPFPGWCAFNLGVAAREAELPFFAVPGKSGQGSIFRENARLGLVFGGEPQELTVAVRPLDRPFLEQHCGGTSFDLVKIDVEGAELQVIQGLEDIRWSCMYVELSTGREGAQTLEEFLSEARQRWPTAQLADVRQLEEVAEVVLTAV